MQAEISWWRKTNDTSAQHIKKNHNNQIEDRPCEWVSTNYPPPQLLSFDIDIIPLHQ